MRILTSEALASELQPREYAASNVSVVVPVKEINDYVRRAVEHLREAGYTDCEILVVPDHATEEIEGATVLPSWPVITPGEKRDMAARLAKGSILAFLDDDAYPAPGWLEAALPHLAAPGVAAVGGPGVTPPDNSPRQRASGWILASPLGSGKYTYRYRVGKLQDVDDFPSMNLLVRREDFEAVGGFKSGYWPGEDTVLCRKLVNEQRKRIVYEPSAVVYHHRRAVLVPHLRQQARYARHRGNFARRFPGNSRRLAYTVPSLFVIGLVVGPILGRRSRILRTVYRTCVASYLAAQAGTGLWIWRQDRDVRVAGWSTVGLAATHLTYGVEYLRGALTGDLKH